MEIRFPAYRNFESLRISANDAMMSLLIGVRLGSRSLTQVPSQRQHEMLPVLFPDIPDVRKTCPAAFEDLSGHHLLDRHVTSDPSSQNRSTNRDVYAERNGADRGGAGPSV